MRTHPAVVAALALLSLSCTDSIAPQPAGHYELVAVNGAPLPFVQVPTPGGFTMPPVAIGDLLLRDDGTYAYGAGGYLAGGYSLDGDRLTLRQFPVGGANEVRGFVGGDSAVVDIPGSSQVTALALSPGITGLRLLFRRAAAPAPAIASGIYGLTTVNGNGQPFILSDGVQNGVRTVESVEYDTLTFMDGVFFRNHRFVKTAVDGQLRNASSYDFYGSYRGRPDSLVLTLYYIPFIGIPAVTRYRIEPQQLVRRTAYTTGTAEERFTRK